MIVAWSRSRRHSRFPSQLRATPRRAIAIISGDPMRRLPFIGSPSDRSMIRLRQAHNFGRVSDLAFGPECGIEQFQRQRRVAD